MTLENPDQEEITYLIEQGRFVTEDELTEIWKREHEQKRYFLNACAPSPFHWHFQQAYNALTSNLFLPGLSGLLNGIEASLCTTMCRLEGRDLDGDLGYVMSNQLLRAAAAHGMNIELLALPDETDFRAKLPTKKDGVQLVKLRNNICHGNFGQFTKEVEGRSLFTPECLGKVSAQLLQVSFNWTKYLRDFYHQQGWVRTGSEGLITPENPLDHWLTS